MIVCFSAQAFAKELSLSESFSQLETKLVSWLDSSKTLKQISQKQKEEGQKLLIDFLELKQRFETSQESEKALLQRVTTLSLEVKKLLDSSAQFEQRFSQLTLENAALISDRDEWKAKAQFRGKAMGILTIGCLLIFGGWVANEFLEGAD
jgi:preprotein translocase subunit Sec63